MEIISYNKKVRVTGGRNAAVIRQEWELSTDSRIGGRS